MGRHVPRERHLVRHNDHRQAFLGQVLHDAQDFPDHLRIERRSRLVEEQDFRIHRQGAGDCDSLLLSAGQLGDPEMHAVGQTDFLQVL